MPYDASENIWKIPVRTVDGEPGGYFEPENWARAWGRSDLPAYLRRGRTWLGRPQAQHFEVLYRLCHVDGIDQYLLLYRFGDSFTERDYGRIMPPARVAAWLAEEGYPVPRELARSVRRKRRRGRIDRTPHPLTEAQLQVWKALEGRAMTAKQLSSHITGRTTDEDAMRKRVEGIRATGRKIKSLAGVGYCRPDKPPPA